MMKRMLAALGGVVILGVAAFAAYSPAEAATRPMHVTGVTMRAMNRVAPCFKATPTTAQGFANMFASVSTKEWGAADVSISVPLSDGRSVWLYGDTFSEGRFVHSTAIVQTKGCLHVSNGGAQLLPNDDDRHIYWIESGKQIIAGRLSVRARGVEITDPSNPWGFKDAGFSRDALVTVDYYGNLHFVSWGPKIVSPAPDPGQFVKLDDNPHHFGYSERAHPEFKLASGKTLWTTCQNWDDGVLHPFADYRPIFSER